MRILAIDPGGTTGYAWGILKENSGITVNSSQAIFAHLQLYNYLVDQKPDWIVYESFEYRNRARPGLVLVSAELIGVIKLYVDQYKPGVTSQTAAEAGAGGKRGSSFYDNHRLKLMDLYAIGKPHANDAMRHLLKWYTFGVGYQFNKGEGEIHGRN